MYGSSAAAPPSRSRPKKAPIRSSSGVENLAICHFREPCSPVFWWKSSVDRKDRMGAPPIRAPIGTGPPPFAPPWPIYPRTIFSGSGVLALKRGIKTGQLLRVHGLVFRLRCDTTVLRLGSVKGSLTHLGAALLRLSFRTLVHPRTLLRRLLACPLLRLLPHPLLRLFPRLRLRGGLTVETIRTNPRPLIANHISLIPATRQAGRQIHMWPGSTETHETPIG